MKMEIQSMHIKLPRGSRTFIFGSVLVKAKPSDLDILIVYDSAVVTPGRAYLRHKCFLDNIKRKHMPSDRCYFANVWRRTTNYDL